MKSQAGYRDWGSVRARLTRVQESLDRAEQPAQEDIARIYRERSRAAESAAEIRETDGRFSPSARPLMVFHLGPGRYAVPSSDVSEILRNPRIAPVPGAPPTVAGVIQVRGEVHPVYDLRRQLGIDVAPPNGSGVIMMMRLRARSFGVRVDGVEEIAPLADRERGRPGETTHVAWVTEDLVSVLDSESLWGKKS